MDETIWQAANRPESLILFGGSFNPPHMAHVLAVYALRAYFPKARVLVAPTYRHAFDKELMPFDLRVSMLRAVFDGQPGIEVSTIERDIHDSTSYTIDVVRALHRADPARRLWILIGADILGTLPQWRDYAQLARLAKFIIFPRAGYDNSQALPIVALPNISSHEIRDDMAIGRWDAVRAKVPQAVFQYLRTNV